MVIEDHPPSVFADIGPETGPRLGHLGSPCCSVLQSIRRPFHIPPATAVRTSAHQMRRVESGSSEKEIRLAVFWRPRRHPCCVSDAAVEHSAADTGRGTGNPFRGGFFTTRGAAG